MHGITKGSVVFSKNLFFQSSFLIFHINFYKYSVLGLDMSGYILHMFFGRTLAIIWRGTWQTDDRLDFAWWYHTLPLIME